MEENPSRNDPHHDPDDDGAWEDEMAEGEAEDGEAVDGMTDDGREADAETPDQGYEIDLDEHSPVDLNEAIQDAVEAVERAGQTGGNGNREADAGTGGVSPDAAKLQERLLRTLADFDNYRKRTDREKESLRRLGVIDVMRDALSINDNLERALQSPGGIEDLKQGVRMILRQYEEFLRRHGVEGFDSLGERFDPAVHEAVATQTSSEVSEPTVSEELQKGYRFHDQLLRPSLVYVAMPSAAPESQPSAAPESQPSAAPESQPSAAPESQPSAAPESQPPAAEVSGSEEVEEESEEVEGRQGD